MNTNFKLLISLIMVFSILSCASAQKEGKYTVKSAKKVVIENFHNDLEIIGTDGKDIIIKTSNFEAPPKRAEGLKPIYGSHADNTGVGVAAVEENGVVILKLASKMSSSSDHEIHIPRTMDIKVAFSNPWAEDVEIEDMEGEIEVATLNGDVELKGVVGPVTLSTINGEVEADFKSLSQKGPTSINCINGEIEVKIPASSKANVFIKTISGEAFSNFDLKAKTKDGMHQIGGSEVSGNINGGGVTLKLNTINGKIYLRKK